MKRLAFIIIACIFFIILIQFWVRSYQQNASLLSSPTWWSIQSVDTMKYSRDMTAQMMDNPSFDTVIDKQISDIATLGSTHVAIATPYDEEFVPMLTRWVLAARKHNLHVWFRGNFSGWEKWFDHKAITREEHTALLEKFIVNHKELFEDGDFFTACPECENGGLGDPRQTGDTEGHRQFLIREYNVAISSFAKINKKVSPALHSMNYDVAKLIMDKPTTKALGGIVAIDHYVKSPKRLASDIASIAASSGGKVFLGEFGVPIPDIHGKLSADQQSAWIRDALENLIKEPSLIGVNYWVNVGGSTELWNETTARPAVKTITDFYTPKQVQGSVVNQFSKPITKAKVKSMYRETTTDTSGRFALPIYLQDNTLYVSSPDYADTTTQIANFTDTTKIIIQKSHSSFLQAAIDYINSLFI